ncbi:tetratricopeptide repeat protein [Tenacibaculum xiamenense]|uniref:tetratricopeptide repeat protein n=1 Tax=Tenacibaculum xiamenense TaxID=1261553 RepID=UPI0038B6424D
MLDLIEKKYKKALIYFQKGIDADNTYWPSYINKARTEYSLSNYNEGIATLKTMLGICDSKYWISYAKLYLALGYFNNGNNCEEAIKYINQSKSLKMYPELLNQIISLEEKINKACI